MRRFTAKGLLNFPNIIGKKKQKTRQPEDEVVIKECFCPNGHNLVSPKVDIKGKNGILIKVKKGRKTGFIALSPVCGDKSKVTLDVELEEGEILELLCPICNVPLPVYAPCECGGDMVTLFCDKQGNYCNCIGICNRVGCTHAEIKQGTDLFNIYRRKGEIRGSQNYI
jgi:hypothetical protein